MNYDCPETLPISRNEFSQIELFKNIQFEKLAGFLLRCSVKYFEKNETILSPATRKDGSWAESGIRVVEEDEADRIFLEGTENAMVSYVVAPSEPQKGSVCYKMIISADTHELCYFEKAPIKNDASVGFLPFDMKIISLQRKK